MEFYQQNNKHQAPPPTTNLMALIALFISFGSFLYGSRTDLQFGASVASILCAYFSRKNGSFSPMATVALIISILSLIFSLLLTIAIFLFFTLAKDPTYSQFFDALNKTLTLYQ